MARSDGVRDVPTRVGATHTLPSPRASFLPPPPPSARSSCSDDEKEALALKCGLSLRQGEKNEMKGEEEEEGHEKRGRCIQ
jgi:hypothetical protein